MVFNSIGGKFFPAEICGIAGVVDLSVRSNVLSKSVQDNVSAFGSLEFWVLGGYMFTVWDS